MIKAGRGGRSYTTYPVKDEYCIEFFFLLLRGSVKKVEKLVIPLTS